MRSIHDLSGAELQEYKMYRDRLNDRTLVHKHDEYREAINKILWKGPNQQVHELRHQLARAEERIAQLELHVGIVGDNPVTDYVQSSGRIVRHESGPPNIVMKGASAGVSEQAITNGQVPGTDMQSIVDQIEKPKPRGRKAARYTTDKDANGFWHVLDRETDEYVQNLGPYKTRKQAKLNVDALNQEADKQDNPELEVRTAAGAGVDFANLESQTGPPADVTTTEVRADAGNSVGFESTVEVTEEMPDGSPPPAEDPDPLA